MALVWVRAYPNQRRSALGKPSVWVQRVNLQRYMSVYSRTWRQALSPSPDSLESQGWSKDVLEEENPLMPHTGWQHFRDQQILDADIFSLLG